MTWTRWLLPWARIQTADPTDRAPAPDAHPPQATSESGSRDQLAVTAVSETSSEPSGLISTASPYSRPGRSRTASTGHALGRVWRARRQTLDISLNIGDHPLMTTRSQEQAGDHGRLERHGDQRQHVPGHDRHDGQSRHRPVHRPAASAGKSTTPKASVSGVAQEAPAVEPVSASERAPRGPAPPGPGATASRHGIADKARTAITA